MNFFQFNKNNYLTLTLIFTGYVLDYMNHPLKQAKISVISPKMDLSNTTDYMGNFQVNIGNIIGNVTLRVETSGYMTGQK